MAGLMTKGEFALVAFIFALVYMAEYMPKAGARIGAWFDKRGAAGPSDTPPSEGG